MLCLICENSEAVERGVFFTSGLSLKQVQPKESYIEIGL